MRAAVCRTRSARARQCSAVKNKGSRLCMPGFEPNLVKEPLNHVCKMDCQLIPSREREKLASGKSGKAGSDHSEATLARRVPAALRQGRTTWSASRAAETDRR